MMESPSVNIFGKPVFLSLEQIPGSVVAGSREGVP